MGKRTVLLLLLGFSFKAPAQEIYTLKKCIDYGLKNNRNNAIYVNEKHIADAKAREILSDYLPRVSISAAFDNNLRLQQSIIPAGVFGPDEIRGSLSQRYATDAVVQAEQVIYNQSLLIGIRANKYLKQQASLNRIQNREAIIYNISMSYFQVLVYRQQLELLQTNSNTYKQQIEIYTLQAGKGILLQKDLDKIVVDYNNTDSQIRIAQSNLDLAMNELKFEMGHPIADNILLNTVTQWEMPDDEDTSTTFSPLERTGYKLELVNAKILETEQARIKAEGMPVLSVYFKYGAVSFSDHFRDTYTESFPYATAGIKLSIPILDFYNRDSRYRQAKLKHTNAEENLKLAENRYATDYENARTKLVQARANVAISKRNIELAGQVLKVTSLQLQKGTTNLTDWLNTQYALKEAQNTYLGSLYLFYQASIDLEKSKGTLQSFYNSL
nr:TolC family protein [uncultured Flavobacterium sp.]